MARRATRTHPTTHRLSAHRFTLRCELLEQREVPSAPVTGDDHPLSPDAGHGDTLDPVDTVVYYAEEPGTIGQPLLTAPRGRFAVADGGGHPTSVTVYADATRTYLGTIVPFGSDFTGGARTATGDVTGDGIEDIVVGSGSGSPAMVKVFDGGNLAEVRAFAAYDVGFTGAVFVAVGDVSGDGRADIVTGAGAGGGPHVQVFDGHGLFPGGVTSANAPAPRLGFFAYAAEFRGGVSVAAADVNGDGRADIVTGAGPGGGPHVTAFDADDLSVLANFFAYDPGFRGGVLVAAGDFNGDGRAEIATGPGVGGGPRVRVFDTATPTQDVYPFDGDGRGGVTVAVADVNRDGQAELVVGTGPGTNAQVKLVDPRTGATEWAFPAASDLLGVFVG